MFIDVRKIGDKKVFVSYPDGIEIPFIEGFVTKVFFREVNGKKRTSFTFFNDGRIVTLEMFAEGIMYENLIRDLILLHGKLKLEIIQEGHYFKIKVT